MARLSIGWLWVVICLVGCASAPSKPQIEEALDKSYQSFKAHFIAPDGRVRRPSDNDNSVSEGQAYAMILALAMDDRETFDRCYQWTEQHLSRLGSFGDHLLAWKWEEGKVKDFTPASDADLDYAYALLCASIHWEEPAYHEKAALVANDILLKETLLSPFGHLLLPGTWGMEGAAIVLNPSYFSPAWYRAFAQAFEDERWLGLIESGYAMLEALQKEGKSGLVPDWCLLLPKGQYGLTPRLSRDYWWDAFRTPWRLYMDWRWHGDPRAKASLDGFYTFYKREWKREGSIAERYSFRGERRLNIENPVSYVPVILSALAQEDVLWTKAYGKLEAGMVEGAFVSPEECYLNCWGLLGLVALTDRLDVLDPFGRLPSSLLPQK